AVVQSRSMPNLYIMPAGPASPHPAELLSSVSMRNLIERWRGEYDHIVIDSPPVLSVTDPVLLSVEVDAVVLVVRSGNTTKHALRRARDTLTQVNAKIAGLVV